MGCQWTMPRNDFNYKSNGWCWQWFIIDADANAEHVEYHAMWQAMQRHCLCWILPFDRSAALFYFDGNLSDFLQKIQRVGSSWFILNVNKSSTAIAQHRNMYTCIGNWSAVKSDIKSTKGIFGAQFACIFCPLPTKHGMQIHRIINADDAQQQKSNIAFDAITERIKCVLWLLCWILAHRATCSRPFVTVYKLRIHMCHIKSTMPFRWNCSFAFIRSIRSCVALCWATMGLHTEDKSFPTMKMRSLALICCFRW